MNNDNERLIIKKDLKYKDLVGFYVDGKANIGKIMSMTFSGGHSEASYGYYFECRTPSEEEVEEFIKKYEGHYSCKVIRRRRLTRNDLMKTWGKVDRL